MKTPTLVLTRPREEADTWVAELQAQGYLVQVFPMIEIRAEDEELAALAQAQEQFLRGQYQAVMWVSRPSIRFFFQGMRVSDPCTTECWVTGLGSAEELQAAGIARSQIDCPAFHGLSWDSESLWRVVEPRVKSWVAKQKAALRVLIVHGRDQTGPSYSRHTLADHLAQAGVEVTRVTSYVRERPHFNTEEMVNLQAVLDSETLWVWSSRLALDNLPTSLKIPHTAALVTHERIAAAALARGFDVKATVLPGLENLRQYLANQVSFPSSS